MSQRLKAFLKAVAKLGLALFLALGGLVGAFFLVVWIREKVQAKADAPLATPLTWPSTSVGGGDTLQLTTIWRSGRTQFKVLVRWRSSPQGPIPADAWFTMSFEDKNGFKVVDQRVYLSQMTRLLSETGQETGREWQGSQLMASETYRSLAKLRAFYNHWPLAGPAPTPTPGL